MDLKLSSFSNGIHWFMVTVKKYRLVSIEWS